MLCSLSLEGISRKTVYQFKYRNLRALAPLLAGLLNDYLTTKSMPRKVLVPVSLHRKQLREWGYNQSLLLAEGLSRLIDLPVEGDCLVRQRNNPPQTKIPTAQERRDNVIGAFTCRNDCLRGKKVLLIDDVATSGAILDACAAVLKASGTISVYALTFVREI